jgi:hypothetical protein
MTSCKHFSAYGKYDVADKDLLGGRRWAGRCYFHTLECGVKYTHFSTADPILLLQEFIH